MIARESSKETYCMMDIMSWKPARRNFARDARFAGLWQTYRYLTDVGSFRLYRRIEGA